MPADGRVTHPLSAKLDQRERKRELECHIVALATHQHGVVTQAQLRALGLSSQALYARAANGRLHRVHRGVYALGRPEVPIEGKWMAAVFACGQGALLSHRSAAALHGLIRSARTMVDVTIPRRTGLSRPGIRLHRSTGLVPADRASVKGIPCTSPAWTLLDLARDAPRNVLERACDQAELLRVLDMAAIEELLIRREGQPGTVRLSEVLGTGLVGQDIPRSELERRLLALCRAAELPLPEVNVWVPVPGDEIKVDFLWREQHLIVEVDGFETHRTRQAFGRDRRRDRVLAVHGWRVVRFTWEDVTRRPGHVGEVLARLLGAGAVGPGRGDGRVSATLLA
jgi:very-short-patch-repair endonuclease